MKTKKNKSFRNSLIALAVLIILVTAGFGYAGYYGKTHAQQADSGTELYHVHGVVTDMNEETISLQIEDGEGSALNAGEIVTVPAAAWDKENSPDLAVGSDAALWLYGEVGGEEGSRTMNVLAVVDAAAEEHEEGEEPAEAQVPETEEESASEEPAEEPQSEDTTAEKTAEQVSEEAEAAPGAGE